MKLGRGGGLVLPPLSFSSFEIHGGRMKPSTLGGPVAALAALALLSCAGARPAPASECRLEFFFKAPSRPHDRLADLQRHVQSPSPDGAWQALRPEACALGADAVVVERNQVLNILGQTMVAGYALRWRVEPPAPSAAPAPADGPPAAPAAPPAAPPAPPDLKPGS
jgi:hypothetical protein